MNDTRYAIIAGAAPAGKSPDQIREAFRLPDDLTEEEKLEPLRTVAGESWAYVMGYVSIDSLPPPWSPSPGMRMLNRGSVSLAFRCPVKSTHHANVILNQQD